jgi:uncharacterized protein (TIGR02270 family)
VQDVLVDDDVRLRRRALDAIHVFRDERALASAQGSLRDADPTVRWLAARALLVLGRRGSDVAQTLLDLAQAGGALGEAAAGLHASRLNEEQAVAWVREIIQQEPTRRAGIVAAGSAGYGALVEDLIPLLEDDKSARLAGHAFTMITGIDLEYDDLERDSPDAKEEGDLEDELDIPVEDPDEELPWPSPDAITERWAKERSRYTTGKRFLGGYVRDPGGLREVLARGKQPQRIAAAHELALLGAEGAMYPVKKEACAQARELLGWR